MSFWDKFRRKLEVLNDRPAFIKIVDSTNLWDDYICGVLKIPSDIIEIYKKEGSMTNEYIEGFLQRKKELEDEKIALENEDIEVLVNEAFEEVKDEIRTKVLNEHFEKIEDKAIEIKAIERLVAKELSKIEAQAPIASEEVIDGTEGVEA